MVLVDFRGVMMIVHDKGSMNQYEDLKLEKKCFGLENNNNL